MKKARKGAKKVRQGSFVKEAGRFVIEKAMSAVVLALFILVLYLAGKAFLYRSDYFRLDHVEVKDSFLDQKSTQSIKSRIMGAFKNKNLFSLDLKAIAGSLQAAYPDAKNVSVSLSLPDRLVVSLKLRRPVAIVRADKDYVVDEEGVVLPVTDVSSLKWIPYIDGVALSLGERKSRVISSRRFAAAIELLKNIKDIKSVAGHGIESVDVKDTGNISFVLKNGIEVRIGGDDFKERLVVLARTLMDPRLIAERIKYIDLRFGDAIIGPR